MPIKLALMPDEIEKFLKSAKEYSEFAYQTVQILLKTGMHISVICSPKKHNVKINDTHISWNRPKKKGSVAFTQIKLSDDIKPFVKEYFENVSKHNMTRQNFYILLNTIGEKCGLGEYKISPMSFRHSAACNLLSAGLPETYVCQILNCSSQTLRRSYSRMKQIAIDSELEKIKW